MVVIGSLLGCEKPVDVPLQVNNGANPATETSQGSDAKSDERAHIMPGINFAPPPDDAGADGWQTEELSSAASYQLQQIALHFTSSDKQPVPALSELVASDISFQPLRPAEIETFFEDAAFTIGRDKTAAPKTADTQQGIDEFGEQLTNLLDFANNAHDVKTKVKVFKVDHQDEQLVTSAYMQTWGDADEGTIQSNATWDCVWEIGEKNVILKSLSVRDYLEAVSYTHLTLPTTPYV